MERFLAFARVALAAVAVVWAVLILAAPWLGNRRGQPAAVGVAAATYVVGGAVCHQIPTRSFHVGSAQLPVCARCAGLYLSAALGGLAGLVWGAGSRAKAGWPSRGLLMAAALPTAATVVLEWGGVWAPGNLARALAGVPLGAVVGLLLAAGLSFRGKL